MTAAAIAPRPTEAQAGPCVAAPAPAHGGAALPSAPRTAGRDITPAPGRPVQSGGERSAPLWARRWDRLAWAIAADGISAHERAVTGLLSAARSAGVCPVLLEVLADPGQPEVARERAFGRVALALAQR